MASREQVERSARALFPAGDTRKILAILDDYGVHDWEREKERVQLAILKLSAGNEERLRYYMAVAKEDYRDVLLWADNPPSPEQAAADLENAKQILRKWGTGNETDA